MADFDPYYKWLGIRSTERPPNHYRLLGIDQFESDPDVINGAADRLMAYVQKCANGPHQAYSQKLLNELSAARVCLLAPAKRQAYDRQLKEIVGKGPSNANGNRQGDLQFAIDDFDAKPTASARLKDRKKNPASIAVIASAFTLVLGFLVFQLMGKPVSKDKPATASTRYENGSRQTESKPVRDEPVDQSDPEKDVASAESSKDVAEAPSVAGSAETELTASVASVDAVPKSTENPATPDAAVIAAISKPETSVHPSSTNHGLSETPVEKDEKVSGLATKKPKTTPVKKSKVKEKGFEPLELFSPTFEVIMSRNEKSSISPESAAGRPLPADLMLRAGEANVQCEEVAIKWSVEITERNSIASTLVEKQAQFLDAGSAIKRLDDLLVPMKDRPRYSNDPVAMQQEKLEEQRNNANTIYEARKSEITTGVARVNELNTSLQVVQDQWRQGWDQLNSCRKDWLEFGRPLDKYAHADFEGARQLIENWLAKDELWLDAYCWAAVCAYEVGDYPGALAHVERAEKLCTAPYRNKRLVSQINATRALVVIGFPQQRSKSDGLLVKAMSDADKLHDWQTHFIAGRAAMELGRQAKAKAMFGTAININSTDQSANYWMGCLQTTSSDPSVKNLDAGTRLLETLWSNSDKQSWRMSFALVRAYDAQKRTDEAEKQWQTTMNLAPDVQHNDLKKLRSR